MYNISQPAIERLIFICIVLYTYNFHNHLYNSITLRISPNILRF